MLTRVQLGTGPVRGVLLHPLLEALPRAGAAYAEIEPGRVVAYLLVQGGRKVRASVFRTGRNGSAGEMSLVFGVAPSVQLLLEARSAGRIALVDSTFRFLRKHGYEPSLLDNGFWVRMSHLFGGKLPQRKVLHRLVENERS